MTAPVLAEVLGPRARRRVWLASALSAVLLAVLVFVAYRRLESRGQLAGEKWEQFVEWKAFRFLLEGLQATLEAAGMALVLAIAVGGAMALGRLARNRLVRWAAGIYVEFFRGFPLLLLIYFSFFGLPQLGIDFSRYWYLVLALATYNSAVLGEIFRAGILSLDRGQTDAALAVGMTYWQAMFIVVLPQALRRMVPAIVSQCVTLLKDTSLGFVVGFQELLKHSEIAGRAFKAELQGFVMAAAMYFVVNFALSSVARRLEVRQRRRYRASAISVSGVEDLVVVSGRAD